MLTHCQVVVGIEVQGIVFGDCRIDRVFVPSRIQRTGANRQLHIGIGRDTRIVLVLVVGLIIGVFARDRPAFQGFEDRLQLDAGNRMIRPRRGCAEEGITRRVDDQILVPAQEFTRHIALRVPTDETSGVGITQGAGSSGLLGVGVEKGRLLRVPLSHISRDEGIDRLADIPVLVGDHGAILRGVVAGETETHLIRTARQGDRMIVQATCAQGVRRGIALFQVIDLVSFGEDTILPDPLQGACLVLLEQLFPTADVAIARPILVRETGLLIGGDIIGQSGLLRVADGSFPTQVETIVNIDFRLPLGMLGGDQDHTTSGSCTIDRRRGGILQDRNAFDVIGVQCAEIPLYVVDQDKRRTAIDGERTTDVERFLLSGT